MPAIEEICTITAKGQTTVPKAIRQALGVGYGGKIAFRAEDGVVTVHAQPMEHEDPALAPFLALLEADMAARSDAIVPIPADLIARMEALMPEREVDLDEPIIGDVDL